MSQPKDVRFSPKGLWTAPANIAAPRGGLLEAENIVLRRPGLAEPRPGMPKATVWAYDGTYPQTNRLLPGPDSTYIGVDVSNVSASETKVRWQNNTEILPPSGSTGQMRFNVGYIKSRRAQGNIYLSTLDGLRKVNESLGAVAYRALPPTPGMIITGEAAGVAVLSGFYAAYRVVTRRKDAAGLVARSAPSGRALFQAASDQLVNFDILLHKTSSQFLSGDVIEVYRTLNETTNPPSDTMYLVGEVEIDSTDITAGYISLSDNTPDTETQRALYTNEDQGGAEAANGWPPAARSLELFNGSLFLANVTYPAELELGWTVNRTGFASSGALGVHLAGNTATVSVTNLSDTITVNSSAAIKVGMAISISSPSWVGGYVGLVYVRSIVDGTHIQLTQTWNGSTGSQSATFVDTIKVYDGTNYAIFPTYTVEATERGLRGRASLSGSTTYPTSVLTIDILDDDNEAVTIYDYARKRFLLRALDETATIQIAATSGDQYSPVLPDITSAIASTGTYYSFAPTQVKNGLAWSNNREPSHFPDANFEQIGDDNEAILAIHAIRNALLVFKTDGVWRVSGAGAESGFRVDELDRNLRLLTPDTACVLGDKVFGWADTGVFALDENGPENISDQAISDLLHPVEIKIGVGSTSAAGAWVCAGRREDEIFLGVPAVGALSVAERVYVWNQAQGGWTRWFASGTLRHGLSTPDGLRLLDGLFVRTEADPNASGYVPWLDEATSVTVSAVSGLAVTINAGSGWSPAVGDVIKRGAVYARVTAVTDTTHFTVNTAITTGAGSAYVAYEARITPIASYGGDPGSLKIWGDGSLSWDSLGDVATAELAFTSSLSGTAVTTTRTVSGSTRGESWNFRTPRRHARTSRLYPSVRIRQAGANWAFSALELQYRPTTGKARLR